MEHKHENSVACLDMHAFTSLLYVLLQLYERKAPINILSRSKAPKTQQVERCQHARKASDVFCFYQPGRYISTHKLFAYWGFFAKVPVPVSFAILNCVLKLLFRTCFLFIAVIFLVIFILNSEKYGETFL